MPTGAYDMQMSVTARPFTLTNHDDRTLRSVFCAYTAMATFWLLFATAVGVLMAYKFGAPDFWPGAWLTFGRLRPIHTNDTFYGWASVALVGLAYYVAARSSRTRLYSAKLAWIGLALFNLAAAAGTVALALGFNDGDLEYREWSWPIRLIFLTALGVTAWNLIGTVARRSTEGIYLSSRQSLQSYVAEFYEADALCQLVALRRG
jgi:cytochrome c oxidase cbb3-type subunit I